MKISKELFILYLINMKVLIGNESEKDIKSCTCNDPKCAGWIFIDSKFENIQQKPTTKHLIIDTTIQTLEEHISVINSNISMNKLKEYGLTLGGHITRGVLDGYDMKSAIFEQILKNICDTMINYSAINFKDDVKVYKENDDNGKTWKKIKLSERNSPSQFAFDVLDVVRLSLHTDKNVSKLREFLDIQILPIKLFSMEVSDKDYKKERFTAVVVEIKSQILPTAIIVVKADQKSE